MLSRQEIFDKVWDWFVTEGNPRSVGPDGECLYRGPDGARCAAGVLIPDELYKGKLESVGVYGLPRELLRAIGVEDKDVGFLRALQWAHDEAWDRGSMEKRLQVFAIEEELNTPG